jgi:hypothetical protein
VTATDLAAPLSQNSPMLEADPTDARFVVNASRIDGPSDFDCLLQVSGDRGHTWLPARPVPQLPPGAEHCYAPEVGFDRAGKLYYLFVGLHGLGNVPMGVFLTSSNDRARTFSPPRLVLGPRNYSVRMAVDRDVGRHGRIHLVWLSATIDPARGGFPATTNPILGAHSDDGGRTFSAPVVVSDPARSRVVAPALALGRNHQVHVAYYDLGDDARDYQGLEGPTWEGEWSIVAVTSLDGGRSFTRRGVVNSHVVPPERVMLIFTMPPPALAADGSGRLYVSWWDARNGDWDVLLSRSADDGGSWSPAIRVNDDPLANGRNQYMPRLSVAPGGRVDVVFYDRRDDPDNVRNSVYYTHSTDHGRHFTANIRVSSRSFYSDIGTRYPIPSASGLVEFGSRIALLARPSSSLTAWTDTRMVPRGEEHQDIFATEVDVGGDRTTNRWPALVAILLVGTAIVGVGLRSARRRRAARRRMSEADDGVAT